MADDHTNEVENRLTALETTQTAHAADIKELQGDRKKVLIGFCLALGGVLWRTIEEKVGF